MTKTSYFEHGKQYILSDYRNAKVSTLKFTDFLESNKCFDINDGEVIADIGAGGASGLYHMAKSFPNAEFCGIDYNKPLVDWVNNTLWRKTSELCLSSMSLIYGDWTRPDEISNNLKPKRIKGVLSVHSLCTQKNFKDAALSLIKLNPNWIAFNSLFYDGPLDVLIHIRDHESDLADDNPNADFNIHSIPAAKEFMKTYNYILSKNEPFDIGQVLHRPENLKRGTYTIQTEWSKYTQFSGPVFLPWHFLLFCKNT